MEPNTPDLSRLAPELIEALDPAELAILEHALAESEPRVSRALAHWAAARAHVASQLAADVPPAELLVLYALSDEPAALSPDEQARLQDARAEIDDALEAHPALQAIVGRIRADRDAFYGFWDEQRVAPRVRAVDRAPVRAAPQRRPAASRWVARAAAALAVVLFVAALVMIAQRDVGFESVQTAEGEVHELMLPDGSRVQLGPNTNLAFNVVPDEQRRVRLTGEALFDVVDADAPFVIETHEALLTVLGTTFGVFADAARTEVVVVDGAVEVASRMAPDAPIRLSAGQRSQVAGGQMPAPPAAADVAESLAWTGTWFFRGTPLEEIAARLSRHYGVRIEVPRHLAQERITGAFAQDAPVEQTLQTLATALGIRVEREAPGRYRFTSLDG